MPKITPDNKLISVSLNPGESVTVPTGEQWSVICSVAASGIGDLTVNGTPFIGFDDAYVKHNKTKVKFDGDDTIKLNSGYGALISGYEVST